MITETWMEKENYPMHGQDLTDFHGLGRDLRGNKQPQDPTIYGQICGSICVMQRKAKSEAKVGY